MATLMATSDAIVHIIKKNAEIITWFNNKGHVAMHVT